MSDAHDACLRCEQPLTTPGVVSYACEHGCTFCGPCRNGPLAGVCPNCGGRLLATSDTHETDHAGKSRS
ncbi:MAG: DUF1272 domain-containing protein [Planctomycetota bacterium]